MKKPRPLKRIGRKRRMLGWTLLTLGVLVAGVWVWSGWAGGTHYSTRGQVRVRGGEVSVTGEYWGSTTLSGVYLRLHGDEERLEWAFWYGWQVHRYSGGAHHVYGVLWFSESQRMGPKLRLTFWPIPLLLWTFAALLLRSGIVARRRALSGGCKSCGYDLAGLGAEVTCPECGKGAGTK